MNNWKRISRKLRAGLVQINGNLTITITDATKNELLRREWIEMGQVYRFDRTTGKRELEWGPCLTLKGRKIFQERYS